MIKRKTNIIKDDKPKNIINQSYIIISSKIENNYQYQLRYNLLDGKLYFVIINNSDHCICHKIEIVDSCKVEQMIEQCKDDCKHDNCNCNDNCNDNCNNDCKCNKCKNKTHPSICLTIQQPCLPCKDGKSIIFKCNYSKYESYNKGDLVRYENAVYSYIGNEPSIPSSFKASDWCLFLKDGVCDCDDNGSSLTCSCSSCSCDDKQSCSCSNSSNKCSVNDKKINRNIISDNESLGFYYAFLKDNIDISKDKSKTNVKIKYETIEESDKDIYEEMNKYIVFKKTGLYKITNQYSYIGTGDIKVFTLLLDSLNNKSFDNNLKVKGSYFSFNGLTVGTNQFQHSYFVRVIKPFSYLIPIFYQEVENDFSVLKNDTWISIERIK